jgi:hypothetical protein
VVGQDHDAMSLGRRVVGALLRVIAIVGGLGICGWVALWLAFTV